MGRRGMALVFALTLIFLLALVTWAFLNFSDHSILVSRRLGEELQALHGAEAGLRYALTLEKWSTQGEHKLELTTSEVTVEVRPGPPVVILSTGRSGPMQRVIELTLSESGRVLDRLER